LDWAAGGGFERLLGDHRITPNFVDVLADAWESGI
jgi:hypothetical protein